MLSKSCPNFLKILVSLFIFSLGALFLPKVALAVDPSVILSPSSGTYYVGQSFAVDVNLNNPDALNHTETYLDLSFNQSVLELKSVTNKELYYDYLDETDVTTANSNGIYEVRANFFGSAYDYSGRVLTLNFEVISAGTGNLTFDSSTSYIQDESNTNFGDATFTDGSYTTQAAETESTLTLNTRQDNWANDDIEPVTVTLDTQGNDVVGVDLILNYDPALFEYVDREWMNLFSEERGFSVDSTTGTITLSGIDNDNQSLNTSGDVVKFNFRAVSNGTGAFSFDWTSGSTTDTNIVDYNNTNTDLLQTAPASKSITISDGATLDFDFNLLDYTGSADKTGQLTVVGPSETSSFTTAVTSGDASVTGLNLGSLTFGSSYDLRLNVAGYLDETINNKTINTGSNGPYDFVDVRPGDLNNDGVVNSNDLYSLYNDWYSTTQPPADYNGDGKVNTFDVGIMYTYFNQTDNV
jgi:hypothetical protein